MKTLYLRGIPEDVVRAAKVAAAEKGQTLTRLVEDALRSYLVRSPDPRLREIAEDERWFEQNRGKLVRRYPGQFVAVVNRRVLDHDAEFGDLATRLRKRMGGGPIFIGRCVREEPVEQLRSPRVAPR